MWINSKQCYDFKCPVFHIYVYIKINVNRPYCLKMYIYERCRAREREHWMFGTTLIRYPHTIKNKNLISSTLILNGTKLIFSNRGNEKFFFTSFDLTWCEFLSDFLLCDWIFHKTKKKAHTHTNTNLYNNNNNIKKKKKHFTYSFSHKFDWLQNLIQFYFELSF